MSAVERPLLLNPGPVTLSQRVRASLALPDLCHREPEFFDLQDEIRSGLLQVYDLSPEHWAAVLLGGSGTAAVEAMVASLVPADGRLLVLENGVYGERIHRIADIHGIACEALHGEWDAALDVAAVAARLADGDWPPVTHVAVVHHETTTGRLNPVAEIARVCAARGVALLADTVSSFGGELIDFDSGQSAGGLAAVAATANKCLHGVPGVAVVVVRRDLLQRAHTRSLYLDLANWCRAQDQRGTPFTPPVHAFYALREALREFAADGGLAARHGHYLGLAERLADGLGKLGIEPLLPREDSSAVLRSYRLPQSLGYAALHDALKREGFVIYAGQGRLSRDIFRVATMGAVVASDIDRLLTVVAGLMLDRA